MADREYQDALGAITYFVSTEASQVVAFILSRLPSALAADVFKTLPGNEQPEIAFHIARIDRPEIEPLNTRIARDLASRIPTPLKWILDPTEPQLSGPEILDRILKILGSATQEAIQKRLKEMDPDLLIGAHTTVSPTKQSAEPTAKPATRQNTLVRGGILAGILIIAFLLLKQIPQKPDSSTDPSPDRPAAQPSGSKQTRESGPRQTQDQPLILSGKTKRPNKNEPLQPGDRIETDAENSMILNLPEKAGKLRVEPETNVEVDNADPESDAPPALNLRLGNIVIQVQQPDLTVRSPLVEVTAPEGSVYRMRVVLNSATTVSVLRGTVRLQPLIEAEQDHLNLKTGQEARIAPSGRIVVQNKKPDR
ncbi:MAG: hypothetical protein O7G87_14665 [bacterium]|nr:hypothetical protein [bacterium]